MKNEVLSYCHQLLSLPLKRSRSLVNLVLSLSSNTQGRSVAQLSLSAFFQHQYASVYDLLDELAKDAKDYVKLQTLARQFCWQTAYLPSGAGRPPWDVVVLTTDVTPCPYVFASTLADRQAIAVPNGARQARTNLSVGYNLSAINLCHFSDNWSLPLALERVAFDESAAQCAQRQLGQLLGDEVLGLSDSLVVNVADSGYGTAAFLAPLYERHSNLVTLTRLKHGTKVFKQWPPPSAADQGKAPPAQKYYGEASYLILHSDTKQYRKAKSRETYSVRRGSISDTPADEQLTWYTTMGRQQRRVLIQVQRWNNYLLRARKGHLMKDKPLDLLRVQCLDAQTAQPVFRREQYLVLSGPRRREVTTRQARDYYRSRSDVEAYFRTAKRQLLLDQLQTSRRQHLDNYLVVVMLAGWLAYLTAGQLRAGVQYPWERYLPLKPVESESTRPRPSLTQSLRGAASYYSTLDLTAFAPPKSKGGSGRVKGTRLPPKKRQPVRRKTAKKVSSA